MIKKFMSITGEQAFTIGIVGMVLVMGGLVISTFHYISEGGVQNISLAFYIIGGAMIFTTGGRLGLAPIILLKE